MPYDEISPPLINYPVLIMWISIYALAGCISITKPYLVSEPNKPIRGYGFSVLPPPGGHWFVFDSIMPKGVIFYKADPTKFNLPDQAPAMSKSTYFVAVLDMDRKGMDISTPQKLLTSLNETLWRTQGEDRIQLTDFKADVANAYGTFCVHYTIRQEERDNKYYPGKVLDITAEGQICKLPDSDAFLVHAFSSERKVKGAPSGIDDQLREEVEDFFKYLMVNPVSATIQ